MKANSAVETTMTSEKLQAENADLRQRLEEAEETIRAIQTGAVDAFVVQEPEGHRIYTLEGADRPYRILVEQMQQGAATLQADGSIVYCNQRLAEMLDMSHEKLIGVSLDRFVATEDHATYEDLLWQGQTQSCRGEARLRRSDGELVSVLLTFNVLPQDCGAVIGMVATDLTTQKHHEQLAAVHNALRESEQRFRMIADHMAQLAWTCDEFGNVTWYNKRWLEYTGQSFEELKGWDWSKVQHPDHLDRVVGKVRRSAESGEPWEDTFPLRGADGSYRWFLSRAVPIRDERGEIVRWFGTNTDITEQREAEEALIDADRRKDEFLATLAHELRGPLAPIANMLEIIKRAEGNEYVTHQVRSTMEHQLGHMIRLIDDLLDVSRISRGRVELKRERVELSSLVPQVIEACRPLVEQSKHQIEVALPTEPIHLHADPVRLAQILSNLLNNSCKYMELGGKILFTAEREGSDVVIRVVDTGIGIPSDKLDSIFEMFNQVDQSLERSRGGLGIGLTLVKRLVEMHDGTVTAHSEGAGLGSEFVVRLPTLIETTRADHPKEPVAEAPVTGRRILVVDDNRASATSLALLLKLTGNETQVAYDGVEAVEKASDYRPDTILLDIGLPRMNGYDACRAIREQSWANQVVVVALTGWGQDEDRQKSAAAGFNGHLVKPVDYADLSRLLAKFRPATT